MKRWVKVRSPFADASRVRFVEAPPPLPEAPKRRRAPREQIATARARRAGEPVAPYVTGEVPPGWASVADGSGAAVRATVTDNWHGCYLALAGALCEAGCPLEGVVAVIARAHLVDPQWAAHLPNRESAARSTVARYVAGETIAGLATLRAEFPGVAAAFEAAVAELDATEHSPVVRRVRARVGPPVAEGELLNATEAAEVITREVRDAEGLVVIAASVGAGKTQGVLAVARELPERVEGKRPPTTHRMGYVAPTHKLAAQVAEQGPNSLTLRSPLAHQTDGDATCAYAEGARALARGGQSVRFEMCEGRGERRCDLYDGCSARDGADGDRDAGFVVSVHQLTGAVRKEIGARGRLIVDEPGDPLALEPITADDLAVALRCGGSFEREYEAKMYPALVAFAAWVERIGEVNADRLTTAPDMIRAAACEVPADVLTAAGIDPTGENIGDAIIAAAAMARVNEHGEGAPGLPPALREHVPLLARSKPALVLDASTGSRVRHLLRRALREPCFAGCVSETDGDRCVNLVGPNDALTDALEHPGPVIVLDASARVHVEALRVARPDLRYVDLRVGDGAPIERTILATNRATYSALLPRGVPDVDVALPMLRGAVAWLTEDPSTTCAALFLPLRLEVPVAFALRPDDGATLAMVRASGFSKALLARAAELLRPVLATWPGELLTGHYGALRGRDDWKHVDAVMTLGDPRPNVGAEIEKALYAGRSFDARADELAACELQQAHGRLRTPHRKRAGRALHVGSVVPLGWEGLAVDVRPLPVGRPRTVAAMTAAELESRRAASGLSARAFAKALGLSPMALSRYLSGARAVPSPVALAASALTPSVTETPSKKNLLWGVSVTPSAEPATGVSVTPMAAGWRASGDALATGVSVRCPTAEPDPAGAQPRAARPAPLAPTGAKVLSLPLPTPAPTRLAAGDHEPHRPVPPHRNGGSR